MDSVFNADLNILCTSANAQYAIIIIVTLEDKPSLLLTIWTEWFPVDLSLGQ